ncbi:hypothetical protein KTG15_06070 [Methanobacterium sp. YSL]|nr:hypothetical protein [Methanobacterium sp. YSL]
MVEKKWYCPSFKIDSIVWKYVNLLLGLFRSKGFKIDSIVWKSGSARYWADKQPGFKIDSIVWKSFQCNLLLTGL